MKINFKGLKSEKLISFFKEVYSKYEVLHPYEMTLEQKRVKNSTMQAQPILSFKSLFRGGRSYKIKLGIFIKDSDNALVADLPDKVIKGWFAHELGHLVDYENYSNWQMIPYGIKYISSTDFKKKVEHQADQYAIDYGFGHEIIEAKKFILSSPLFGHSYQKIIRDFYMPIEEVEKKV